MTHCLGGSARSESHRQPSCLRISGQCGFTLIELLIAIVIIAILSGMMLPALVSARRQAQYALCEHNLRTIGAALHAYIIHTNGIMPMGHNIDGSSFGPTEPTNLIYLSNPARGWNGPTGLGFLLTRGHLDDAGVLFGSNNNVCTIEELKKFKDGPSSQPCAALSQLFYLHGGLGRSGDLGRLHPSKVILMDWQGYRLVGGQKTDVTHNHDALVSHALHADGSVSQYVAQSKDDLLDKLNCVQDSEGAFDFADRAFR